MSLPVYTLAFYNLFGGDYKEDNPWNSDDWVAPGT